MQSSVLFDGRSFTVDGRRQLLLSGSAHYPRCHPSMWQALFAKMKRNHLNTLETYVFWGEHDAGPQAAGPRYDFSGPKDLFAFIQAAGDAGLHVILRIGPYVCAEYSLGGFPLWLRDLPGIQFRTYNKPFMDAVEEWVMYLGARLQRQRLIAPQGPVILVQLENEYDMVADGTGDTGQKYLQWVGDLGARLNINVPLIMCFGAVDSVIETINAFYAHKHVEDHRRRHPSQPPIWTECWTGWYDVWGVPHHKRSTADLAYSIARFFAVGGAGVNLYMYFGGTNFDWRTSMYLQITSYDYDAPLNEYLQDTSKSKHLATMFSILLQHWEPLFVDPSCDPVIERDAQTGLIAHLWGSDFAFLANDTETEAHWPGLDDSVPAKSVTLAQYSLDSKRDARTFKSLYNTSVNLSVVQPTKWRNLSELDSGGFQTPWKIQSAALGPDESGWTISETPLTQTTLWANQSDYCIYQFEVEFDTAPGTLDELSLSVEAADFVRLYCVEDDIGTWSFLGCSELPLWEDRVPNKWNVYSAYPARNHTVVSKRPIRHGSSLKLCLVTCSLGMVKGEWQLGSSLEQERKGILSEPEIVVTRSGQTSKSNRVGSWRCCPGFISAHTDGEWDVALDNELETPQWCRRSFRLKPNVLGSAVLDMSSMDKGIIWVNGRCLGRYWLVCGTRDRNGFLDGSPISSCAAGSPTQALYHLPQWSLNANGENELLVLSERGCKGLSEIRVLVDG